MESGSVLSEPAGSGNRGFAAERSVSMVCKWKYECFIHNRKKKNIYETKRRDKNETIMHFINRPDSKSA